jgi:hypothetical protein
VRAYVPCMLGASIGGGLGALYVRSLFCEGLRELYVRSLYK